MNSIDLKVTKTSVSITNQYTLNQGEYNVDKCVFDFTSDYDDLIKKAIFVYGDNITEMVILDNECNIPYELLQSSTEFTLKVYAYEVQDDELVQRYSPTPLKIFLREGSYQGSNEVITPTQFEQYEAKLNEGLQEVDAKLDEVDDKLEEVDEALDGVEEATTEANNLNIDVSDKVDGDVTITLTKKDASTKSVVLSDGTSLQFNWNGTELGIKTTDDEEYTYVDLKGPQGDIGPQGEAFQIKKTYSTIQAMIDDYDNMEINDYVMISGNVEQEDNAKLFVKTEEEDPTYRWQYLADFSGASGIQGPTGLTPNIQIGSVTSGSTPSVTRTGTNENPILNFVLQKGDTGATGATGPQGVGIASIVKTSTSGSVDTYTITYTDGTTSTFDVTNGEVSQAQLDEVIEDLDNANQEIENLKTLRNILPKVSGSGESITLDNTGETTLYDIDLYGNTSQDGEPTPDTPQPIHSVSGDNTIVVCGKNLINIQGIVKGRLDNGVIGYESNVTALTLNDNSFSFTTNANYRGVTTDFIKVSSGTYMLSTDNLNSTYQTKFACYDSSKTWLQDATFTALSSEKKITATIPSGTEYLRIYFALPSSGTITITNPQLEQGSTATTYEPYSGDTYPINLPSGIELCKIGDYKDTFKISDGRNLFDEANQPFETGTITATGNNSGSPTTMRMVDYMEIEPGNYVASYTSTNGAFINIVALYDKNKVFIERLTALTNNQFTIPNNAKYIRICFNTAQASTMQRDYFSNIQIEKGSTATPYQPYGIGKWYLHKAINSVRITTATYISGNSNENYAQMNVSNLPLGVSNIGTYDLCNYFAFYSGASQAGKSQSGFRRTNSTTSTTTAFSVPRSIATIDTPKASFENWLSTHETIYKYPLETPSDIEITDTTLISQLNAIKNAMSKKGQTNISQVNNDLPFELDVIALRDLSNIFEL